MTVFMKQKVWNQKTVMELCIQKLYSKNHIMEINTVNIQFFFGKLKNIMNK